MEGRFLYQQATLVVVEEVVMVETQTLIASGMVRVEEVLQVIQETAGEVQ